jgi:hypothetical protein
MITNRMGKLSQYSTEMTLKGIQFREIQLEDKGNVGRLVLIAKFLVLDLTEEDPSPGFTLYCRELTSDCGESEAYFSPAFQ